ncbi:MAG: siderophore-interacting protein [Nitriliruptoraceae bacterium]
MHGRVIATARLTPNIVRVVLGGDGLDGFEPVPYTDAYVNVAIPPAGAPYTAPFDLAEVKAQLPREQWPVRRRYTVRRFDPVERLLILDVVVHGDAGVGGPWAATAVPGDALVFTGPGGGYRPDPDADWHLLVGDEAALPAIAASLEAIPSGAPTIVRLVCDGPEHEVELASPGALDLAWLHRTGAPSDADLLPDAVRHLDVPPGRVHAFVHGEAGEVRAIRRHLLAERGVAREDLSCSPYWRRHLTDEAWREIKPRWKAEVERDVA